MIYLYFVIIRTKLNESMMVMFDEMSLISLSIKFFQVLEIDLALFVSIYVYTY
jgi:hypothetical protein